jgi:hypothetical protein
MTYQPRTAEEPVAIEVVLSTTISLCVLSDIFVTAIEGGSSYWANIIAEPNPYREEQYEPFYLSAKFVDLEDSSSVHNGKIAVRDLTKGLKNILDPKFVCSGRLKGLCLQLLADPDAADYDAYDADAIIQATLFNDIIFG